MLAKWISTPNRINGMTLIRFIPLPLPTGPAVQPWGGSLHSSTNQVLSSSITGVLADPNHGTNSRHGGWGSENKRLRNTKKFGTWNSGPWSAWKTRPEPESSEDDLGKGSLLPGTEKTSHPLCRQTIRGRGDAPMKNSKLRAGWLICEWEGKLVVDHKNWKKVYPEKIAKAISNGISCHMFSEAMAASRKCWLHRWQARRKSRILRVPVT